MNQCGMVLEYMRDNGGITGLDATNDLGIQRLGARIWELKHELGYQIKSELVIVKNRRGEPCRVKRYSLSE